MNAEKKLDKNKIEIIEKENIIKQVEISNSKLLEWKKKSEHGQVCGIFGCHEKPTVSCSQCWNWYCDIHSTTHFHVY